MSLGLFANGEQRSAFSSNLGFLAAAVGSTLGLSNFWRFPYLTYAYGGGAFLIPYLIALLTAGVPLLLLEYGLGHREQASSALAFAKLSRSSEWLGWWMPVFLFFGIMFYYQVVLGWCANFLIFSQHLRWGQDPQGFFLEKFLGLTRGPGTLGGLRWPLAAATAGLWLATWFVCLREVRHGIERVCKIFVPLLFVAVVLLAVWSCRLPGAARGLRYFLAPDWGRLADYRVWIAAYGQVFFSLSIGFGIMIAYASYLPRRADLVGNAVLMCVADTVFALVAGLAIFATLGYLSQAKGLLVEQVVKSGPMLAFVVYPEAISRLPVGRSAFGGLFFLALLLAGFTHGLAIVESITSAVRDKFKLSRGVIVSWLCALGFAGSLLFTTGAGLYWLDIVDHFLNHYGLVTACLLECVIVGHFLKAAELREHINRNAGIRLNRGWDWMIQYWIPAVLLITLYRAIGEELARPYGGYPVPAILGLGVSWLAATLVVAFALAAFPWDPARLRREHVPGANELFL